MFNLPAVGEQKRGLGGWKRIRCPIGPSTWSCWVVVVAVVDAAVAAPECESEGCEPIPNAELAMKMN